MLTAETTIIKRAFKTELDLNNAQKTACERHAEAARFTYNWGLERKIEAYQAGRKTPNEYELHKELTRLKKSELAWLYQVSKCAPQAALHDLDEAFTHFFRRVKEKKSGKKVKVGYPKFKKKKEGVSFRLYGTIIVYENAIQLPRLGRLRLKECGYLPTHAVKIYHATVSKRANRWFVSISVDTPIPIAAPSGKPIVGVDLGITRLATISDGMVVENPHALQRKLKQIRRSSKKVSRRKKGSRNWRKAVTQLAKQHFHVSNIRINALHYATSYLAKTKSLIILEDLAVRSLLSNHSLAQSIADAGWFRFRRQLTYKSAWNGSKVILANRSYPSSKRCSSCGFVKAEILLKERIYYCDNCGLVIDRDLNAARNLEQWITASSAGI